MSTFTDLINIRIGFYRKAVFIESFFDYYTLFLTGEKPPVRESIQIIREDYHRLEQALAEQGITTQNIYYVASPLLYYRTNHSFPFTSRQKIEGVIKYEVKDYLPLKNSDYLVDFISFGNQAAAFTMEKQHIRELLESLGRYAANLKSLIPFDIAVYQAVISQTEKNSFVFMEMARDCMYIQYIKDHIFKNSIFVPRCEQQHYQSLLSSQLQMLLKKAENPFVYLNIRSSTDDQFAKTNQEVFDRLGLVYHKFPVHKYKQYFPLDAPEVLSETVSLAGALKITNGSPLTRINLLKEEFRPRPQDYISIKHFAAAGGLIILILVISLMGLMVDISTTEQRIMQLKQAAEKVSLEAFGNPVVKDAERKTMLNQMVAKYGQVRKATDRRFSGVKLLEELSVHMPQGVRVEYNDIIIEKDHIRFSGRARTFSDIDKIRESLLVSDYFTSVEVANTGSTGSTKGFAVTFLFDIEVAEELEGDSI
ncbi:MAG: hypothetical protein ACOC7U_07905 [Spirochaetota bacterium]